MELLEKEFETVKQNIETLRANWKSLMELNEEKIETMTKRVCYGDLAEMNSVIYHLECDIGYLKENLEDLRPLIVLKCGHCERTTKTYGKTTLYNCKRCRKKQRAIALGKDLTFLDYDSGSECE